MLASQNIVEIGSTPPVPQPRSAKGGRDDGHSFGDSLQHSMEKLKNGFRPKYETVPASRNTAHPDLLKEQLLPEDASPEKAVESADVKCVKGAKEIKPVSVADDCEQASLNIPVAEQKAAAAGLREAHSKEKASESTIEKKHNSAASQSHKHKEAIEEESAPQAAPVTSSSVVPVPPPAVPQNNNSSTQKIPAIPVKTPDVAATDGKAAPPKVQSGILQAKSKTVNKTTEVADQSSPGGIPSNGAFAQKVLDKVPAGEVSHPSLEVGAVHASGQQSPSSHSLVATTPKATEPTGLDRMAFTQSLDVHPVHSPEPHQQGIEVMVPVDGTEQVQLRAVVDKEGKIHATVTTQSETSHHALSGSVQNITNFLETERVRVDSLTISHTQLQSGFDLRRDGSQSMPQQQQRRDAEQPASADVSNRADQGDGPQSNHSNVASLPAVSAWQHSDTQRYISVRA